MTRVTLILGSASFLVHAFAVVTPWWVDSGDDDNERYGPYTGLWQTCLSKGFGFEEYKKHVCTSLVYVEDRIQWTRTMEVFAMIVMAVSLLCGIGKEFVLKNNRVLLKAGAGSGLAAGALMLIGVFIYSSWIADLNKDSSDKLRIKPHASFGLCIVAAIGAIVSGMLFIVWYKSDTTTNAQQSVPGPTTVQYGHMAGPDAARIT